jgi:uncharacterized membrane protein YbaN (DUF454 family)
MNHLLKILLRILMVLLISICWTQPEQMVWKVILVGIVLFVSFVIYELQRAPIINDD